MERNKAAEIFEQCIDEIIDTWVKAVRESGSVVSSEDLSEGGLRDHVPQVIEEIGALLRSNAEPNIFNTREARVAAYTRYTQDYRISELITEISLLRQILFRYLYDAVRREPSTADLPEFIRASAIINSYLDEEMRYGSSIFCEALKNA